MNNSENSWSIWFNRFANFRKNAKTHSQTAKTRRKLRTANSNLDSPSIFAIAEEKTFVSENGIGDQLGFIVQYKINWVFEYLNNDDENFR